MEKVTFWWEGNKKKAIVIAICILIILLIAGSIIILTHKTANPPSHTSITLKQQHQTAIQTTHPAPTINFQQYTTLPGITPFTIPQTINAYTFKNNFTNTAILSIAAKFGLTNIKTTNDNSLVVFNTTDIHHRGVMAFDKVSGSFTYQSFADVKPTSYTTGMQPAAEAQAILQDIGLWDSTLSCSITYQQKNIAYTYVECHRDWKKIGAPIYNPIGLLNISEETPLASLAEGAVDENTPEDPTITNVQLNGIGQPNAEGKARPNDFNTVTIAISPEGDIMDMVSNLRWFDPTKTTTVAQNQLYTRQQAISRLQNHLAVFSLTIPAGSGAVDLTKVYPSNQAFSSNATITDEQFAYIEKPEGILQTHFVPMYIFRGYTTLSSGYRVNFVQMIPALLDQTTFLSMNTTRASKRSLISTLMASIISQLSPQAFAQTPIPDSGLQLRSFDLTPTTLNNPTDVPITPTNSLTPTVKPTLSPSKNLVCNFGVANETITIPGLGQMSLSRSGNTYQFVSTNTDFPINSIQDVLNALSNAASQQYAILIASMLQQFLPEGSHTMDGYDLSTTDGVKQLLTNDSKFATIPLPPKDVIGVSSVGVEGDNKSISNPYQLDAFALKNASPFTILNTTSVQSVQQQILPILASAIQNNQLATLANQDNPFPANMISELDFVTFIQKSFAGQRCYVTGNSPLLFVYSPIKQVVHITLPSSTTYMDPSSTNLQWDVITNPNGTLQVGQASRVVSQNLYFEYNPSVTLSPTLTGYIFPLSQWQSRLHLIARQLGLTINETAALQREAGNIIKILPTAPYVRFSFANQHELEKKLPLSISPQPTHIYRFDILITPLSQAKAVQEPQLQPLQRNGLTVIEIGARVN